MSNDSAARFNRICRCVALGVLVVGVGASLIIRPASLDDFGQVYMAGLIARHRAWDAIYPIPNPNSVDNPGSPEGSAMRPRYAELAREYGVGEANRFMQPPPVAFVYWPLSFVSYRQAYWIWMGAMIFCAWAVAVDAGRILEICVGHESRWAGWLALGIACSPLMYRTLRTAKVSPLLALLLSRAAIGLLRKDGFGAGLAIGLAGWLKYIGAALAPLALVMRRWRTVGGMLVVGIIGLGLCLLIMGNGPIRTFTREIAPLLSRPHMWRGNQSFEGMLLRVIGKAPLPASVNTVLKAAQITWLFIILGLMVRRKRWDAPAVFAAAMAMIGWMLIFSPIYWEHYAVYLCPFWGWIAFEGLRSRANAVRDVIGIALLWVPLAVMPGVKLPEPFASHMLWGTVVISQLAMERLRDQRVLETEAVAAA